MRRAPPSEELSGRRGRRRWICSHRRQIFSRRHRRGHAPRRSGLQYSRRLRRHRAPPCRHQRDRAPCSSGLQAPRCRWRGHALAGPRWGRTLLEGGGGAMPLKGPHPALARLLPTTVASAPPPSPTSMRGEKRDKAGA